MTPGWDEQRDLLPRSMHGDAEGANTLVRSLYLQDLRAVPGARSVLLPFAFPSLSHLDEAIGLVIERSRQVEGLSPVTGAWVRGGYRSLRRFVKETGTEDVLLSG